MIMKSFKGMKSLKSLGVAGNVVRVNLEGGLMEAYNNAVIELHDAECKLAKARKHYDKWLHESLTCPFEDMDEITETMVAPAWRKVAKSHKKVDAAKVHLDKVKCCMIWSDRLSGYVGKGNKGSKGGESDSESYDNYLIVEQLTNG